MRSRICACWSGLARRNQPDETSMGWELARARTDDTLQTVVPRYRLPVIALSSFERLGEVRSFLCGFTLLVQLDDTALRDHCDVLSPRFAERQVRRGALGLTSPCSTMPRCLRRSIFVATASVHMLASTCFSGRTIATTRAMQNMELTENLVRLSEAISHAVQRHELAVRLCAFVSHRARGWLKKSGWQTPLFASLPFPTNANARKTAAAKGHAQAQTAQPRL